jgi:Cu2+-exporting ATPase
MELLSSHPLATAVCDYLKPLVSGSGAILDSFDSVTGRGIKAEYNSQLFLIGNEDFLNKYGIFESREGERFEGFSGTLVYLACANRVIGRLLVSDPVKPSASAAVAELQADGIDVYLLSGDRVSSVQSVAGELGILHAMGGMLPMDKEGVIQKLRAEGKIVAMVGDGINDSVALASADLSIAMAKGSDIATDVAQVTLLGSDLRAIPEFIRISRRAVAVIRQNLFWAFFYNVLAIPVAAGVLYPTFGFLLNPMLAGAAMAASSVSVVLNSLRLGGGK